MILSHGSTRRAGFDSGWPSTRTRPARISSSALRREQWPVAAIALLRRTPSEDSDSETGWGLRNAEPSARAPRLESGREPDRESGRPCGALPERPSAREPWPLRASPACSAGLALDNSLEESFIDSRADSFLDDPEDEFVCERLLAVDPALPECLGGTVILLGKMRTWCVKWSMPSRVSARERLPTVSKQGFNGLPIFKSLHNYHYGTFIITVHTPTSTPKSGKIALQIAAGETPYCAL